MADRDSSFSLAHLLLDNPLDLYGSIFISSSVRLKQAAPWATPDWYLDDPNYLSRSYHTNGTKSIGPPSPLRLAALRLGRLFSVASIVDELPRYTHARGLADLCTLDDRLAWSPAGFAAAGLAGMLSGSICMKYRLARRVTSEFQ